MPLHIVKQQNQTSTAGGYLEIGWLAGWLALQDTLQQVQDIFEVKVIELFCEEMG